MLDRQPTKPNRYAVYDENHNFLRHEYHERADEPTQEGDALNKANLLPDAVATALGLTGNPQVKDALDKLKALVNTAQTTANGRAQIATGSYTGTGTYGVNNKNSITLPFRPYLVFIKSDYEGAGGTSFAMVNGNNSVAIWEAGAANISGDRYAKLEWASNGVKWYSDVNSSGQLNNAGIVFTYVAIG